MGQSTASEMNRATQVWAQVEQCRVPQPAQPLPVPATARVPPSLLRLMAANVENIREVCWLLHCRQAIGSSAMLILRNASNLTWQSAQEYSYSGMTTPFIQE